MDLLPIKSQRPAESDYGRLFEIERRVTELFNLAGVTRDMPWNDVLEHMKAFGKVQARQNPCTNDPDRPVQTGCIFRLTCPRLNVRGGNRSAAADETLAFLVWPQVGRGKFCLRPVARSSVTGDFKQKVNVERRRGVETWQDGGPIDVGSRYGRLEVGDSSL
jgi:hypothetical protein